MRSFLDAMNKEYPHPDCLFEELHPVFRWCAVVFGFVYFGGALLLPFVAR
jgi:hypothetical protein